MNPRLRMMTILIETVAFYAEDPKGRRGIDCFGACCYQTADGKQCAIGRRVDDPVGLRGSVYTLDDLYGLDTLLRDKADHGLSVRFWKDLQLFHDRNEHWRNDGLTIHGANAFARFAADIRVGSFDP